MKKICIVAFSDIEEDIENIRERLDKLEKKRKK